MTAGRNNITNNKEWCTPQKYVEAIKNFWEKEGICLDPCSNNYSIVKANVEYILPLNDGLKEEWNFKTIFVNPPYGRDKEKGTTIKDWLRKCNEARKLYNSQIIALIPVATNTSHWKEFVFGCANAICFLYDTRLKFMENGIESKKGAPMACCLVYYGNEIDRFKKCFEKYGAVINIKQFLTK